jgi:hypothetical protein
MIANRNSLTLLEPEQVVTLKGSVLKSACRTGTTCALNLFASSATIITEPPLYPLQADVFISASDAGGACDSPLTLDASATSGGGGRPWKSVTWSVTLPEQSTGVATVPSASQQVELAAIESYLNSVGSISAPITIPFNMLNSTAYSITLAVANFLQTADDDYSFSSVDVVITNAASASTPFVYFDGPSHRVVRAFDEFSAVASAVLPSCLTSASVSYTWKTYENTTYFSVASQSVNNKRMRLDPYSLTAGQTYYFYVTATVDNGGVGSSLLTVYVDIGSVYVSISGAVLLLYHIRHH